eukprot:CAMPEP_0177743860 /NCGR_PEP_ID=MMETSP0484_2-20121128/29422_1 /TAXON_ID=354590 /ORGANISM="Rhodomonas lens, Strain RHODO" /LENGTH=69 /DNA_ID=CAMNT_0019258293 /DNA_START=27 /DNA_END=233 /DNA_ORIENTATION=-
MNDLRAFLLGEEGGSSRQASSSLSRWTSERARPQVATSTLLGAFKGRVAAHRQELFRTCLKQVASMKTS